MSSFSVAGLDHEIGVREGGVIGAASDPAERGIPIVGRDD